MVTLNFDLIKRSYKPIHVYFPPVFITTEQKLYVHTGFYFEEERLSNRGKIIKMHLKRRNMKI